MYFNMVKKAVKEIHTSLIRMTSGRTSRTNSESSNNDQFFTRNNHINHHHITNIMNNQNHQITNNNDTISSTRSNSSMSRQNQVGLGYVCNNPECPKIQTLRKELKETSNIQTKVQSVNSNYNQVNKVVEYYSDAVKMPPLKSNFSNNQEELRSIMTNLKQSEGYRLLEERCSFDSANGQNSTINTDLLTENELHSLTILTGLADHYLFELNDTQTRTNSNSSGVSRVVTDESYSDEVG